MNSDIFYTYCEAFYWKNLNEVNNSDKFASNANLKSTQNMNYLTVCLYMDNPKVAVINIPEIFAAL